jgi:hypothetical protein
MRTIACMKWGTKYGPGYANVLLAMLNRFMTSPFRLICFTDDPDGLDPAIETRPLPEVPIPPGSPERGWNKLGLFHPDIDLPAEPVLFLDLDVVITGSMDVFFEVPGEFRISNDWDWRKPGVGNSSVFRFVPGTQDHIWTGFHDDPESARASVRNEQEYVSRTARDLAFWPDPLCRSYKRHCLPRGFLKAFRKPRLPEGARVLIFHGDPKPEDAIVGRSGKWYRPIRPAPWLGEFYQI